MRTRHYLTALALPLVFAACTNEEDLISNSNQAGETLTVTVERGAFGTDTRAAWVDEEKGASFEWTDIDKDKIGMALLNPSDASKVLTNYEMSLIGWYNANGEGSDADYSKKAQNGVKYTDSKPADGNAGAGVFQASGLTVMDGNYIVYHPYDENFAKAGYLAVDFRTNQTAKSTIGDADTEATDVEEAQNNMLAAAGNNAFSYSQPTTITKGGKVAADFATTNLSALVKLNLKSFPKEENLKKVILLEDAENFNATNSGFLKSAYLNAEKIKTQSGISVLENPVYTSMVTFAFTDADANPGLILDADEVNVYMVAGPRTSGKTYSVLLINDGDRASIWRPSAKFNAGEKATISMTFKTEETQGFKTYIVTEGADLKRILETATEYDNQTINILGSLEVADLKTVEAKNLTIQAYGNNPETSVKFVAKSSNVTLASASDDTKGLVFKAPVTFETASNKTITLAGKVSMESLANKGTMEISGTDVEVKTFTNNGSVTINQKTTFNTTGNVINNGSIEIAASSTGSSPANGGLWNIGKGTTLTNNGEINNYYTVNNFGTIDNSNGTYVQKLEGKFIGNYDIAADKRGNYVIEVKSNEQFAYADGTTCTTIRVVNAAISGTTTLTGKTIEKRIELTGKSVSLKLSNTILNGGLYIINDNTNATIEGTATITTLQINAKSSLTINAGSVIKANAIINNGTGSIKEGANGIPADVKTLSSTGTGTWDNYPQIVSSFNN